MSRILITGMNKLQVTENFYLRQNLKVVPSHYSLISCLRDMGHTVEQRAISFDDNISGYDKVIVFLTSPRQLNALYFYNGLISVFKRPDCILAFDDWQIKDIYKSLEKCKDEEELFNNFTLRNQEYKLEKEEYLKYKERFLQGLNIILSKENKVLLSAFKGGDLNKLIDYPTNLLFSYNPNPYHINKIGNSLIKEKRFNFASLVQSKTKKWIKKQNTSWPIDYYGSKKEKQIRLKEEEMCNVFAKDWGCLMPSYDNVGSGWWRARPLQVADAKSILIGDKEELMIYYRNEEMSTKKACELENMDTFQLQEFALKQKEALYKNHPLSKDVQKAELTVILSL